MMNAEQGTSKDEVVMNFELSVPADGTS